MTKYKEPEPCGTVSINYQGAWASLKFGVKEGDSLITLSAHRQSMQDLLEEVAQIAQARYDVMKETEEAHYRLSPTPFDPRAFGFDMQSCIDSRDIADAIRAKAKELSK